MRKTNLIITSFIALGWIFFAACEQQDPSLMDTIVAGNEPPVENCDIGHRTQTPGGWGAPAAGQNPGSIRDAHFDAIFPIGLVVGCSGGNRLRFTSSAAVQAFLPSGGKPQALDGTYLNPTNKDVKNSLAGHIAALKLSVEFDHYLEDFGEAEFLLCDLVLCSGDFAGRKVAEVLSAANRALGGCSSPLTIKEAHDLVSSINENFVDGEIDNGVLCCPKSKHSSNETAGFETI